MSPYSGQSTKVIAALCTPMNPLPSSWTNERKSAFCWASISRSPPVKKSTASKSFRFLALYSSFFLVRASVSVRSVVSQSPVSVPSRSIVAIAWETASCRYPFSSPITKRCFFGGVGGIGPADPCAQPRLHRAKLNTRNEIRIRFFLLFIRSHPTFSPRDYHYQRIQTNMKRIRIGLTEVESLCNLASHTDRTLCGSVQLGIPWNARAASTSP